MAGPARNQGNPHGEAYDRGLEGRPLSAGLLRASERDDSILDAWREGKADRPGDQPDSTPEPTTPADEAPAPAPTTPAPAPPRGARGGRGARGARGARGGRTSGNRRPASGTGIRRYARQASVVNPTGGALPVGITAGVGAAGLFFGAIAYALVLSVVDYGPTGPLLWFKAKFLNEAAGSSSSSGSSGTTTPAPEGTVKIPPPGTPYGQNSGGTGSYLSTPAAPATGATA